MMIFVFKEKHSKTKPKTKTKPETLGPFLNAQWILLDSSQELACAPAESLEHMSSSCHSEEQRPYFAFRALYGFSRSRRF